MHWQMSFFLKNLPLIYAVSVIRTGLPVFLMKVMSNARGCLQAALMKCKKAFLHLV
jgi:hypothetical protein